MARKITNDEALVRVSRIAAIKGIPVTGDEALALAEFYTTDPRANALLVRAAKIINTKAIDANGAQLLKMARFIA